MFVWLVLQCSEKKRHSCILMTFASLWYDSSHATTQQQSMSARHSLLCGGGGTQLLHVGVTVVYITVLTLFMADSPDSGTEWSTLGILSRHGWKQLSCAEQLSQEMQMEAQWGWMDSGLFLVARLIMTTLQHKITPGNFHQRA